MIITKKITIPELKKYYKPEEVIGYCRECKNYGQIWSCPPHEFNVEEYVNKFKYAYIVRIKIDIKNCKDQDEAVELFHEIRKKFNIALLKFEKESPNTKVLYSGECHFCTQCSRKDNRPCIDKNKIRYSLESLGFKVSDICENILNEKLNWQNSKKPNHLFSIGAVLTNSELNVFLSKK